MKNLITYIFIGLTACTAKAQDIHFTMFNASPIVLNPACAGMFDGTFRTSINYKSQWRTVSNAFNTVSFNADGALLKNTANSAYLGLGLNFYRDVAGSTKFGTTKINLSLSGILKAGKYNTISIGLMGGWGQRSISLDNLEWDAQFIGNSYDASRPSYENYSFENSSYWDYSAGFLWAYHSASSTMSSFNRVKMEFGGAYHHLSRPKTTGGGLFDDQLHSRAVFHANLQFSPEHYKVSFSPRLKAFLQGPSLEVNLGMMFRVLIQEGSKYTRRKKGFAISAGGYYRVGDAISPSIEVEFAGLTFGYSYDINLSGLTPASFGMGGSEFYLRFQNPNPFFKMSGRPSMR